MSIRQALIALIEHKLIPEDRLDDAVEVSGLRPSPPQWMGFLDQLLVWLGVLAITFSLLFFIAFNWAEIGRFAKFGLVQIAICLSIGGYLYLIRNQSTSSASVSASLMSACILVGVLLALYGQTYQTGADPWQLFFTWAMLILPWVLIGSAPAIWVMWLGLLNMAAVLYYKTFGSLFGFWLSTALGRELGLLWCVFMLNILALVIWELCAKRFLWLREIWATRLIATAAGTAITWLAILPVLDLDRFPAFTIPVWLLWLTGLYLFYRFRKPDLYMLAGAALSLSVVSVTFFARMLIEVMEEHAFLPLALIVIGTGAGFAIWLRSIHQSWSSEQ